MWTNVFKIGGLHHLSWFQLLPQESGLSSPPDIRLRSDHCESDRLLVLSSHLQLQKEGFLSTWTNSFVGPWDPSQGLHNPDDKIKLWLFIPGHHSFIVETAQSAVCQLRVVASGTWTAPGDSEEVSFAVAQSLRNHIERAFVGLSYVRFGDVFSRYHPFSPSDESFRRGQPTVEFIFAAADDAIYVHAIVSAKHIRALCNDDIARALHCSSRDLNDSVQVVVAPHGMRGRLTGFCPGDLVQEVFNSGHFKTSNRLVGLPFQAPEQHGFHLNGQNCYVEVTHGCNGNRMDSHKLNNDKHSQRHLEPKTIKRSVMNGSLGHALLEQTFIYPVEAVTIPVLQTSLPKSSLKRVWLQNWIGPSLSGPSFFLPSSRKMDSVDRSYFLPHKRGFNSSNNSDDSSISSVSYSSSGSDHKMATDDGDLEADADSLTGTQHGLSTKDRTMGSQILAEHKRSNGQLSEGVHITSQNALQYSYSAGVSVGAGLGWDYDEDENQLDMDIKTLLSELGGFGNFFLTDDLPFGEPPGTAEQPDRVISAPDSGDVPSSPGVGVIEFSDQMILPAVFPSSDSLVPVRNAMEESLSTEKDCTDIAALPGLVDITQFTDSAEFDHIVKAEALWTFAPEYGAVQTEVSGSSSPLFGSPYVPESRKVESPSSSSNSYVYNATPPLSTSPLYSHLQERQGAFNKYLGKHGTGATHYTKNCYTVFGNMKEQYTNRVPTKLSKCASYEDTVMSVYTQSATNADEDRTLGMKISPPMKNVLATELDCIMYQSSMCRTRHTLLNLSASSSSSFTRSIQLSGPSNQFPGDTSSVADNSYSQYTTNTKQTDATPHRLSHPFEGISDGPLNAPVGVWRTVGVSKGGMPYNSPNVDASPSLPESFIDDGVYNQRQPLQELLDGMALLVQQATSLVDVTLDADFGDGPSGWLAMQEQLMRGFSCGPAMVHGGCGGSLASCHARDAAGVELVDPLSLDVHASSVFSLLQSDIKVALKSAFETLDGPLSVADWCKGSSQFAEAGTPGDGFSAESTITDCRDSSSTISFLIGEPLSPSLSSVNGSSSLKVSGTIDVYRADEIKQRRSISEINMLESDQQFGSQAKTSLLVLPLPSILVGYQDDWLKTSVNSLQLWEKAPLEPYATQKHMTYRVICPDISPLASAAVNFFQQLGTVYETCKLGSHSPLPFGKMEIDSGKLGSSGFILLDCPQSMEIESGDATLVGSVSDHFLSLTNGWDLTSFLGSLSKVLKALKIDYFSNSNPKDSKYTCVVLYVVCPFPEPAAVLQTLVESSVAVGSVIFSSDMDRRTMLYSQVSKALNGSPAVDEVSSSNVLTISGFNVPKLVLQIISVDTIFRVTNPAFSELAILKETAFTLYNKARRVSRGSFSDVHSSCLPSRSQSQLTMMSINSPISGMWKDCVGSRMTGSSLPREGEWDNSWQAARPSGPRYDSNREYLIQDEVHYMFEPLFILAEPGSIDHGISSSTLNASSESVKVLHGDCGSASSGNVDNFPSSQRDTSDNLDGYGSEHQKSVPCLHCCYGWTEDWRWLVCIWTDSRGELLDSHIFPFGGISSRQDTKGLQSLFVQVLHQGCLVLQACTLLDTAAAKPRDFIISRIGNFYELECQEWQKAICSFDGSDIKRWPHQVRRPLIDDMPVSSNGPLLQPQEMGLVHDRTLPSSSSSMYPPQRKPSEYMKTGLGQTSSRKQIMGGHIASESARGSLHWIKSISFIALAVDHTLQLVSQADTVSQGGTQSTHSVSTSSYLDGFTPVKSLGSTSASYIVIPSSTMHFLPAQPLQLPACLTAESPPLAHLLRSKGSAVPLTTGFVVSKAVPSMRRDSRSNSKDEWPSVLSVSLIDYYGGKHGTQEKTSRESAIKRGDRTTSNGDTKDMAVDTRVILESIAAELHALSWMTVSPTYLERRTALPFHCDMLLRVKRLIHFAEKQLSSHPERLQSH